MTDRFDVDEPLSKDEVTSLPIGDQLAVMRTDIAEIMSILAPLREVLSAAPEAMEKIGPLIQALSESPVLKMIGVKFK